MTERKERRRITRVTLSGAPTVRTHDGVAARLLDLSLAGARLAHCGILRPGAPCLVHFPAALGALHLPAQILWRTILSTAAGLDGERILLSQSGLGFLTLTESQRTGLAALLQQARSGELLTGECQPQAVEPARDFPRLLRRGAAGRLPGKRGREANESPAGGVGVRPARPGAW